MKFIKSKLEDKFKKIESYITSDDDFETYKPSEYTKNCKYSW